MNIRQPVTMQLWQWSLLWFLATVGVVTTGLNLYDYWTFQRPLNQCLKFQISRCDIGDTVLIITYRPTIPEEIS